MSLLQYVKNIIYKAKGFDNVRIPQAYDSFGILMPEASSSVQGIRPFPLPEDEHLFALLWNIHDGHLLSATILPTPYPFCYERSFLSGTRTQLHSHEYLEFFYVLEGEPEDIASFLHMALLEQKALQQFLTFRPRETHVIQDMEDTLRSVLYELSRHDIATPIICSGLMTRVFQMLGSQYEFSLSKKQRQRMNVILFNQLTDFIKLHLNHISIQMLTQEFHFYEDYFNRLLKVQTGMTYIEYLQMLRLERAELLLTETNNTIEQIAEEVGYHNKGYFYRIFIERNNCTPAQYRKKRQERL